MATIMSKGVGIDLGTTNSAVAVLNPTDTDIVLHRDAKARRETTPSCVWKNPKTGEIIVGSQAFKRLGTLPLPVRSIKRIMGDRTTVTLTDDQKTPEEISAVILGEMKRQIEEDVAKFAAPDTQWIVDRAIITVPAYFDQPQIEATREAGRLAKLEVIDLLHEPTAAACYHCWRTGVQDGTFLVYDFGGGTFDVSVLRCVSGNFEVLGIGGNKLLGGDDLDGAIAELLQARLLAEGYALELDVRSDPDDELRLQQLRLLAEGVKKALSNAGEFMLRDSGSLRDKAGNPVFIDTMIELGEVECAMRPIIERTIPYCFDALEIAEKRSGVKLADIDAVILAGGSTHIPMVREMVRQNLCQAGGATDLVADPRASQPHSKCEAPVYEKVDTLVALGAAIRASAVGGLAVWNPQRTVRIAFRGTGATGRRETQISGQVTSPGKEVDLTGGRVRLTVADTGYDDEQKLSPTGVFTFKKVPLQEGAENPLSFEIYDAAGTVVATAGRPISQGKAKPTGGSGSTAVISKSVRLQVLKADGQRGFSELIPALSTLPANKEFTYKHPGNTTLLLLNLFQGTRRIKEIRVPVDSSLAKGTEIHLNLNVDEMSFITVKGRVGDIPFEAQVEWPPDRQPPTAEDMAKLNRKFEEALSYLPPGTRNVEMAKYKKAKDSLEKALAQNQTAKAVNDFEEMESRVDDISDGYGPLEPAKAMFDDLVAECRNFNQYAGALAAETGKAYDDKEVAKSIEVLREQGEKAYAGHDQKTYSDSINALASIQEHAIKFVRDNRPGDGADDQDPAEEAKQLHDYCLQFIAKLRGQAQANKREDVLTRLKELENRVLTLEPEMAKNPKPALQKFQRVLQELQQIKNQLASRSKPGVGEGDIPEEF